jgi:hypothetical protein
MTEPTKAAVVDPAAVEIAAAVSDIVADEAKLPEAVQPILPEALTLETQPPLVTAGGPQGPLGTGATQYLDDMGNVIGLLEAQDVIDAVEPAAEVVLPEPVAAVEFEALPDLVDGDGPPIDVPPEEPDIVATATISFGEIDFGTLGLGELESSVVLDDDSSTNLSLLGVDLDGGLLDSLLTSTAISGLFPGSTLPFAGLPGSAADQGDANSVSFADLLPSTASVVSFPEALPPGDAPPVEVTPPGETGGFGPLDAFPVVIAPPSPSEFDVADLGLIDPNLPVF